MGRRMIPDQFIQLKRQSGVISHRIRHIIVHTIDHPTGASDFVAAAASPGEVGIAVCEGGDQILSAASEGRMILLHMMA